MATVFFTTLVAFYSFCLRHVHFTALLIGTVAYVCYSAACRIRWPSRRRCGDDDDDATARKEAAACSGADDAASCDGSKGRHWSSLFPGILAWIVVAVALGYVSRLSWSRHQEEICAAWREGLQLDLHLPAAAPQQTQPSTARSWPDRPSGRPRGRLQQKIDQALAEAAAVAGAEENASTADVNGTCDEATCSSAAAHGGASQEAGRRQEEDVAAWGSAGCEAIRNDMKAVRKGKGPASGKYVGVGGAVGNALSLLISLQRLEAPFKRWHSERASSSLEADANASRAAACVCMLETLQEARLLAAALPPNDNLVQQATTCEPDMLKPLEAVVISEAEKVREDPSVTFALGLYWSEIGVASTPAPLFGLEQLAGAGHEAGWAEDASGGSSKRVPAALARAEELLKLGEEATADETTRADRGATRALRLYQHAKNLALLHHDDAAEIRYLAAAQAAAANQRAKLASHSLTRLSYFLSLRGRHQKALNVARQALLHGYDPLAAYLQVTIRRVLGELRTAEDVAEAEAVVNAVAGQLPSKALEEQRAAFQEEFWLWRRAAMEDAGSCLALHDVARVLLCYVGRLVFEPSSAPPIVVLPEAQDSSITRQAGSAIFED
eukprot:TRINITY_DN40369_c0_g1_i1.p1 TRINITY_DN40369_c0_g1~~TRINITY_DN40369_c0_g1_i1.p1  ORF type:complete len:612 (+),score=128.44 TRINITY_DN40369_c0_g1_i1:117-1952(+)